MDDNEVEARLAAMHSAYESFFPELKSSSIGNTPGPVVPSDGQATLDYLDTSVFLPASQIKLDASRRYSATSANFLVTLDQLEAAFNNIVNRASHTRTLSLSEGFTQHQASKVINEIAQLLGDIDKFQFERIDAIVVGSNEVSAEDIIRKRRKSLNRRILLLRQEVEQTHQLLTRILSLPSEAYDPDDIYWRMGITPPNQLLLSLAPDWSDMRVLHQKHAPNALCQAYICDAEERTTPICDTFYSFLASSNVPNRLALSEYVFTTGELDFLLSFISSRKQLRNKLEHLYLNNCQLADSDCEVLCEHISQCPNLKSILGHKIPINSLFVNRNNIDCFGAVSLAALIQYGVLRRLGCDGNPLGDAGCYVLLQSILNPYRQARLTMMCPIPIDGESHSLEQLMLKVAELFVFDEENYLTVGMITETENSAEESNTKKKHKKKEKNKRILSIWRRVKVKLFAFFAFLRLRNRGVVMEYISLQNCQLSEISVPLLAIAITDNLYLCDLHLSANHIFTSLDACADVAALIEGEYIRVAELKNTGLEDDGIKLLCQAAKKSKFLQRLDIGKNNMTSTAATWLVNATGDYFMDAFEISTVPARNYGADVL